MKNISKILAITSFSVLSGLFALGVTWLLVALLYVRNNDERLTKVMPALMAGGIAGLTIGLVISLRVSKADPKTQTVIGDKYVGVWGRREVFFGAPALVMILLIPLLNHTARLVGQPADVYVNLVIGLVVLATSLVIYERIPEKLSAIIGMACWLLSLLFLIWFCFFGPGRFGHSSL